MVKVPAEEDDGDPTEVAGRSSELAEPNHFSCHSAVVCPSIRRLTELGAAKPSGSARRDRAAVSLENPHAEWMVIPSMLAAAVPDVAVSSRRCDIPLFANSSATASMTRDFPVPPSPPTN
ncbi:hypothetical protein ACJ41O_008766 [Fusarium nematophilum]